MNPPASEEGRRRSIRVMIAVVNDLGLKAEVIDHCQKVLTYR
jgi:hypothetical protein